MFRSGAQENDANVQSIVNQKDSTGKLTIMLLYVILIIFKVLLTEKKIT